MSSLQKWKDWPSEVRTNKMASNWTTVFALMPFRPNFTAWAALLADRGLLLGAGLRCTEPVCTHAFLLHSHWSSHIIHGLLPHEVARRRALGCPVVFAVHCMYYTVTAPNTFKKTCQMKEKCCQILINKFAVT